MKKRIMSLILALVLALGLCAGASAEEPASLSGVLGDGDKLTWSIDGGVLRVTSGQGWTGSVFAACYNNKGRLAEVKVLTPDKPSAPVSPWVTRAKLFWTGEGLAPKCEPIQTRLAPDKVVTQGVKSWYDLTTPNNVNYVAPRFAQNCVYTLNGAEAELSAVQSAAAKRGAVTEFELNNDGLISAVTCYDYTVCQEDGQVSFCYTAPDGAWVINPVTEKITGKVTAFSTKGELTINGTHYKATELTVEGCEVDVSEAGFRNWGLLGEGAFLNTYDFYLDKSGSICWVEQFDSMDAADVCLVLDARASAGGQLQARLLFADSDVQTVDVVRLDRQDITDADAAGRQLRAKGRSTFYTWKLTPSGYELLEMGAGHEGWETPVSVGDGTDVVALIFKEAAFARAPRKPNYPPLQDMLYSDSKTVFIVGRELPSGEMNYTTYKGFKTVPEINATIVTAVAPRAEHAPNGAARCVYLQSNQCLPEGLVYMSDNAWVIDPELYEDGVCLTHIVDTDGIETQMRLPAELKDAVVSNDSMELGRFADNAYVGKFCAVTGIDENHVVTGLEPVDANHVSAFGNGVITTSAGTWAYDDATRCVFVDLGWIDDPHDMNNTPGVREDTDLYRVNASGTFDPHNFFVPGDVSPDPADDAIYRSVKAVVISAPETPDLADYIYVVRELW